MGGAEPFGSPLPYSVENQTGFSESVYENQVFLCFIRFGNFLGDSEQACQHEAKGYRCDRYNEVAQQLVWLINIHEVGREDGQTVGVGLNMQEG